MACGCGSGGAGQLAYRLTAVIDGQQVTWYVPTLAAVRDAKRNGTVAAVAVPKAEMDEWAAKQETAA